MSRHRNVRGMDYGEDYEGYDDVYGHSVEDDFGVSPSTAEQFIFHRSLQHHQLASFLEEGEEDLKKEEEDETERARRDSDRSLGDSNNFQKPHLSDIEEAQLQSCLEEIRNVVGETIPEHILIETALAHKFNFEKALNSILDQHESSGGGTKNNNNTETQRVCVFNSKQRIIKQKSAIINKKLSNNENQESMQRNPIVYKNFQRSLLSCDTSKQIPRQKYSSNVTNMPLADLIQSHQVSKPQTSLSSLTAPIKSNIGLPPISSMPLSALAGAHLSLSSNSNVVTQGQGSPSLSQLAGSHLDHKGIPEGGVFPNHSLSDSSKHSLSSTPPPQFPFNENIQVSPGASLSSLASAHLTSHPPGLQLLPSQGLGVERPFNASSGLCAPVPNAVCVSSIPSTSLSSLATSYLSMNPPESQNSPSSGLAVRRNPVGSTQGVAGVSLSTFATAHFSPLSPLHPVGNQPVTERSGLDSRHLHKPSTDAANLARTSLSSLATSHLSSAPPLQPIMDLHGRMDTSSVHGVPDCRSIVPSQNINLQAIQSTFIPGREPVKDSKANTPLVCSRITEKNKLATFPTDSSEIPQNAVVTTNNKPTCTSPPGLETSPLRLPPGFMPVKHHIGTSSGDEDEARKRVPTPPGFQSRIAASDNDSFSPIDIQDYIYHFDTMGNKSQKLSAPNRRFIKRNKCCLLAKPSVFGRALCSEYLDQSRELSNQHGVRLASYVFQKHRSSSTYTMHRQFSYQKQKSWTLGNADNREEIIPFDFSSPSPDDIIRQKQAGAFGSVAMVVNTRHNKSKN